MAEFSIEWFTAEGIDPRNADFSILKLFSATKPGEIKNEICEGFGITSIANINGRCCVECKGEFVDFIEFLRSYKPKIKD